MNLADLRRSVREFFATDEASPVPSPLQEPSHLTTKQEFNRLSELLPWTGYWETEQLFAIEGTEAGSVEAIAYAIELNPQTGAMDDMQRLIQECLSDLPEGAGYQIQLWGSPDVSDYLDEFQAVFRPDKLKDDGQRALMARVTSERRRLYEHATLRPPISSRPSVMRTYRAVLCVAIPVKEVSSHAVTRIVQIRETQISKLRTYYQYNRIWNAEDLMRWVRTMLSPRQKIEDPIHYDEGQSLRYQMVARDTVATVGKLGLTLSDPDGNSICVRGLSAQGFPKSFSLHEVALLLGDANKGSMGYPCPVLITVGGRILSFDEEKQKTTMRSARAIQVAESPMGKALPETQKRAADWRLLQNAFDEGIGSVKLFVQILTFPQPEDVARADESAKAIWRSLGFALAPDTYMQVQAMMSSMPMALGPSMLGDLKVAQRLSTKTLANAAAMSPVLGEWRGVGAPVLSFMGRAGQTLGIDLFANPSGNFNASVVGTSGSGKSAFLNELATRYLARGARVWIIDVGRSYEKLCHALGGQFMEFSKTSGLVLNPFSLVEDIDEDMPMLKALMAQMISPSRPLSDYELSQLEMAISNLWEEEGARASVDGLSERLRRACHDGGTLSKGDPRLADGGEAEACDARIRDLAVQLTPYTSEGSYGAFFDGQNNVRFDSNLVVLELEELNQRKDLQSVALFSLMYRITQEMYLSPRDQEKIVIIDEAWDLLQGGQTAGFIESGYRRARKYGGSFITGTQGINDYYRTAAAKAALENSDWLVMLRQKPESVALLQKNLNFTEHMAHLVGSLRTERGSYSEVFMSVGSNGYGVGVLMLDKFSQLMGSANARDFTDVNAKRAEGMNMAEAIDAVLRDRGAM